MFVVRLKSGLKPAVVCFLVLCLGVVAQAATPIFQKDADGLIKPFKAKSISLAEFVRQYASVTDTQIQAAGDWDDELKGSVTVLTVRPIKQEVLAEIFHKVLDDNGFCVVDAPEGTGWIVMRTREARDYTLPIYDSKDVPASYRLMTVFHGLQFANAEEISRNMRSFMPANSRVIPVSESQLLITTHGRNIRKLMEMISQLDVSEAKGLASRRSEKGSSDSCKKREIKVQNLTVERLEVKDLISSPAPSPATSVKPHSSVMSVRGGK